MPNNYKDLPSEFRLYVNNMYYAAMKERDRYGQTECSLQEYWSDNKFWLKENYKKFGNKLDI